MEVGKSCLNFGLMDIGLLLLVLLYFRAPIQRINDTALLMNAWGRDGETWRRRMIRQYWLPPVVYTAFLAGFFILYRINNIPPEAPEWDARMAVAFGLWAAMFPFWPLVICIRADRAYYRLEAWRRMQVEHRIAAGMASPADYYHYIQDAKEDAYKAGRRAGEW